MKDEACKMTKLLNEKHKGILWSIYFLWQKREGEKSERTFIDEVFLFPCKIYLLALLPIYSASASLPALTPVIEVLHRHKNTHKAK